MSVAVTLVVSVAACAAPAADRRPARSPAAAPAARSAPAARAAPAAPAPGTTPGLPAPGGAPATGAPGAPAGPLPPGDGTLPPTAARPPTDGPGVAAEGAALLAAVTTGEPARAMAIFLPEAAYVQVKALRDDELDWVGRLVAHLDLDVAAAHALLGAGAAATTYVALDLPAAHVRWVPPWTCNNRLGYWYAPGGRLVYEEGGTVRSIGVAAMISWRGWWYLVHLGTEHPPPGQGVVDAPAAGVGAYGPTTGC